MLTHQYDPPRRSCRCVERTPKALQRGHLPPLEPHTGISSVARGDHQQRGAPQACELRPSTEILAHAGSGGATLSTNSRNSASSRVRLTSDGVIIKWRLDLDIVGQSPPSRATRTDGRRAPTAGRLLVFHDDTGDDWTHSRYTPPRLMPQIDWHNVAATSRDAS